MPIPISVADYIEIGKISQFLSADDENNFVENPGGVIAPATSELINFVWTGIDWAYNISSTDATLTASTLYLKALIGGYWGQALKVLGNAGGSTVTPSGSSTLTSFRVQFTVPDVMADGDTVLVLDYSGVQPDSVNVYRNNAYIFRNLSAQFSYVLTIQPSTITITFNEGVSNTDTFVIEGLRNV
jgi:hypothetical protein